MLGPRPAGRGPPAHEGVAQHNRPPGPRRIIMIVPLCRRIIPAPAARPAPTAAGGSRGSFPQKRSSPIPPPLPPRAPRTGEGPCLRRSVAAAGRRDGRRSWPHTVCGTVCRALAQARGRAHARADIHNHTRARARTKTHTATITNTRPAGMIPVRVATCRSTLAREQPPALAGSESRRASGTRQARVRVDSGLRLRGSDHAMVATGCASLSLTHTLSLSLD